MDLNPRFFTDTCIFLLSSSMFRISIAHEYLKLKIFTTGIAGGFYKPLACSSIKKNR